jgi:hypothetical protein
MILGNTHYKMFLESYYHFNNLSAIGGVKKHKPLKFDNGTVFFDTQSPFYARALEANAVKSNCYRDDVP